MFRLAFILLLSFVLLAAGITSRDYTIGENYSIKVSTRGVDASFGDLKGTVLFDEANPANSQFEVSVSTASIQTGNKTQDKHARSDNWLSAEKHPRINFTSSAFAKIDEGYSVTGDFSINGRTHSETILFRFDGKTFTGTTTLKRQRYGIEGPFLFGGLVGDVVEVELRVPVM